MLILMRWISSIIGCRNLQLDDTSWGEFCAEDKRKTYTERGLDLNQIAKDYVYMLKQNRGSETGWFSDYDAYLPW